ncbi:PaaI family thioesterase [Nocardioides endophyticus]|uniref:PaaI family thioesterase n=1 Tax=Nocardioides endophyticus TaxID=1353775 RepID=UPI0031EA2D8A
MDLNIWLGRDAETDHDDPAFARLAGALVRVQEVVSGARPPPGLSTEAATTLGRVADQLEPYDVDEAAQVAGRQFRHFSRGQTLLPAVAVDTYDGQRVDGRVTFGRFYLGSNGAVHGGAISLLFDDLLGQVANGPDAPRARTAYLHVNFHRITPIGVELSCHAGIRTVEGRKVHIDGELCHGEEVVASAEGLFVRLEAHQL